MRNFDYDWFVYFPPIIFPDVSPKTFSTYGQCNKIYVILTLKSITNGLLKEFLNH